MFWALNTWFYRLKLSWELSQAFLEANIHWFLTYNIETQY